MPATPRWDPARFYTLQDEWYGVYARTADDRDGENAALAAKFCDPDVRRVLELAAGGGQSAVATAELGYGVEAVELLPHLAARIPAPVKVVVGSFYEVELDGPYGAVCYWDGFGLGDDEDQTRLLRRIHGWLSDGGRALLEIYDPAFWAGRKGTRLEYGDAVRTQDFDGRYWIDTWSRKGAPETAVSQWLRCYTPEELEQLVHGSGLEQEELIHSTELRKDPARRGRSYVVVLRKS